jgi:hypothetical protein
MPAATSCSVLGKNDVHGRLVGELRGRAEVTVEEIPHVVEELLEDRLVEPEVRAQSGTLLGRRRERQDEVDGIADHPCGHEDHHGDAHHHDQTLSDPTDEIPTHLFLPLPTSFRSV